MPWCSPSSGMPWLRAASWSSSGVMPSLMLRTYSARCMDVDNLFNVAGRSVVVTGGSRGIGYMIAEGFVRAGARVVITARKIDAAHAAAERLAAHGDCVSMPADLSSADGRAGFADLVLDRFDGTVHVLVNNAGATW